MRPSPSLIAHMHNDLHCSCGPHLRASLPPCLGPQNHFLIATKTISAEVYVFDYSKHPSKPASGAGECRCLCRHRLWLGS